MHKRMKGNMGYYIHINPMQKGLFSFAHANTCMQNLFCAKSPSQLGLFIIGVKMGCGTPILVASKWHDLTQIPTKLG